MAKRTQGLSGSDLGGFVNVLLSLLFVKVLEKTLLKQEYVR